MNNTKTTTFVLGDPLVIFNDFIEAALKCLDRKGITPVWISFQARSPWVSCYYGVESGEVFDIRWRTVNSVVAGDIWSPKKLPENFELKIIKLDTSDRITLSIIQRLINR